MQRTADHGIIAVKQLTRFRDNENQSAQLRDRSGKSYQSMRFRTSRNRRKQRALLINRDFRAL